MTLLHVMRFFSFTLNILPKSTLVSFSISYSIKFFIILKTLYLTSQLAYSRNVNYLPQNF